MSTIAASPNLHTLLRPRSVAVVGASERPFSLGSVSILNLTQSGYPGELYAVNPNYEAVHGIPCFPDIASLPAPVDCVIAAVPSRLVPQVLTEAGERGVPAALVYSSGFAETGAEGEQLQARIRDIAARYSLTVGGPNCLGIVNFVDPFVGFGAPMTVDLTPGPVAGVCQSGSVAITLLNSGRGLAFSYVVSSGNEAVVTIEDYLNFFVEDPHTRVILAFVEGFRNIPKLREVAARALEVGKPIVVLKVGRSEVAQRTVQAHTGALAGPDALHDAFFKQTGLIRVHDLNELLETAILFRDAGRPPGNQLGAIAISGGEVGLFADLAHDAGLDFASLSDETMRALRELLPPFTNVGNPLDAWGLGDLKETYRRCLTVLGNDPSVDLVTVCQDAQRGLSPEQSELYSDLARSVVAASHELDKPLVFFSNISGGIHPRLKAILDEGGVSALQGTRESLRAIRHWLDYSAHREAARTGRGVEVAEQPSRRTEIDALLVEPRLSEQQSKQLLAAYGIPVTRESLAGSLEEARQAATEIGYPVVLKVDSPEIQHKSDAGVLRLGIEDEETLAHAYEQILAAAASAHPDAAIRGVLVQEMIDHPDALEVIAGAYHDPAFGPVVLFGLGGIYVELLHDVVLRIAPIDETDARAMIDEIRGAAILAGARGRPAVDQDAIVEVLLKLSALAVDLGPALSEVDINPLIVLPAGEGAVAVDALVIAAPQGAVQESA